MVLINRKPKLGKAGMMEIVRDQAEFYDGQVSYYALEATTYDLIELLKSLEIPDEAKEQVVKCACKFAFIVGRDERRFKDREIDELKDKILEAIDIDLNDYQKQSSSA